MAMNPLDQGLAAKYKANGGGLKGRLKTLGSGVMSVAKGVNKVTGGENLSKYFGTKLAKMKAKPEAKKYVSSDVSGKDALKSAGKVGLSIATIAGAGAAAKGIQTASKASSAKASMKRILSKHRSGGDAKMLKSLKDASPNPARKVIVKSSPLNATAKEGKTVTPRGKGAYKEAGLTQRNIKLRTRRDILRDKMNSARDDRKSFPLPNETRRGDYKKSLKRISDGDTLATRDVAEAVSKFYKKPQSVVDNYIKRKKLD